MMGEGRWRHGAVLVPIFADAPHDVVFVERAQHLRRHPGQIGFPGGSADPSDLGDLKRTALREFSEELGVGSERVTVVGRLPELEQVSNRFRITPIVGVLDPNTSFSPDGVEIAGVFAVPLASIFLKGALYEDAKESPARGKTTYALDYEGRRIWGFTARVLRSFVDEWNAEGSALRSAVEAAFLERATASPK
jgi:8-oxo-dGTP pyrophosphatase MutT (NUDIX family)